MRPILFLLLCSLLAAPALAQLGYQQGEARQAPVEESKHEDLAERIKKTRATETSVRPDWYGLFLAWAKMNPGEVLSGLRDQNAFNNFASFMACDWFRDYRSNDVTWPGKQVEIVQKFNERALNPQTRFRLLTYAMLGKYVNEQQAFVFHPLEGAAFSIRFPDDKNFGVEDDCEYKDRPLTPWPTEFLVNFKNQEFITALPMDKTKAEYFLNNLPKNDKGELDRRVVIEIEFDVTAFKAPDNDVRDTIRSLPAVRAEVTARRAIVYADSNRMRELARFGFPEK